MSFAITVGGANFANFWNCLSVSESVIKKILKSVLCAQYMALKNIGIREKHIYFPSWAPVSSTWLFSGVLAVKVELYQDQALIKVAQNQDQVLIRVGLHQVSDRCTLLMRRRVTVVGSVCVCLLSHISTLECLSVLKILSRTQRATEVKIFVGFSLKQLCCRDPAFPPLKAIHTVVFTMW